MGGGFRAWKAAGGAVEEPHAGFVLHAADRLGQGWLGDANGGCRGSQAAMVCDGEDVVDGPDVHGAGSRGRDYQW